MEFLEVSRLHLPVVVCVIPSVGRYDLLLGGLQVSDRLTGMSTELDPAVGGLGLFDVLDRHFRGAVCIPQIGMMHFISQSHRCYENRSQRSDDKLFHDLPFSFKCRSGGTMSIPDNPTDGHSQRAWARV